MEYRIRLEPLHERHAPDLFAVGQDPSLWLYLPGQPFRRLADAKAWIFAAQQEQCKGKRLPYAIVDTASDRAVGSTSFSHMRKEHRSTMIGWTWIAPDYQGTGINAESKYLLLEYAFETMRAIRVDLRIDERNVKSQRAVERLGAVREGVLRQHMIEDGVIRNTVYYSFIDSEWPQTKEHIAGLIRRERARIGTARREPEALPDQCQPILMPD